jgi:microcystin-dependent protein
MGSPYMSEIRIMSFNFAPTGWAQCNGQLLAIAQNQALFALLGTTYGGNGTTTFGLPDLRSRVPLHFGNGRTIGERGGEESHVVTIPELPGHIHLEQATTAAATTNIPGPTVHLATAKGANLYGAATNLVPMASDGIESVGGSLPHTNMQPFLTLNFCIALQGIFPSHT